MHPINSLRPELLARAPRIKFVWTRGRIRARWRAGLYGFYERIEGDRESGLAIHIPRLAVALLCLAVAGYVGVAGAITWRWQRDPHNQVGFWDVLGWPVRPARMAALRADAWLARARDAVAVGHTGEASMLLRRALAFRPGDFEARRLLAEIDLARGQFEAAVEIASQATDYGLPPAAWREWFFALAGELEDAEAALNFARRCQQAGRQAMPVGDRQKLIGHACEALIGLGRAPEAAALAGAEAASAGSDLQLWRARALIEAGDPDAAVRLLATGLALVDEAHEPDFRRTQVRALRKAGRLDEMVRALEDMRHRWPTDPNILAFGVEQRARAGQDAREALDEYFFRFGASAANFELVASTLAEIPEVSLVQRTVAVARTHGFPRENFASILATAFLEAGDWIALTQAVADMEPRFASAPPAPRLWYHWLKALAGAVASPRQTEPVALMDFFRSHVVPLEMYRRSLGALRRAGHYEAAAEVATVARQRFPRSRSVQAEEALIRDARTGSIGHPGASTAVRG